MSDINFLWTENWVFPYGTTRRFAKKLNFARNNLFYSGITLQEALDIAYEPDSDTEVAEIFIEPPESHVLTDEDSADEDEGGLADNLSSRQLAAGTSSNGNFIKENLQNVSTSNSEQTKKITLKLDKAPPNRKFSDGDLLFTKHDFPKENYDMYKNMAYNELFELFFTDELLQLISQQTSNYALFRNCPDPQVSFEDLKVFIGILLVSGYNELPSKRSYWETSKDMRNGMVYEAMRRDRFLQIWYLVKWYWPILTYCLDACVHNAWQLCKKSGRTIPQLVFRRNIAQIYLTRFGNLPKATGRAPRMTDELRFDNMGHFVIPIPNYKRRRCAGNNCSCRGRTMCCKCDLGLCIECFKDFHT